MSEPASLLRDGAHCFKLRVYYEDTDTGGIVYYANYLKFAERARTEVLRELGISQSALIDEAGLAFAVRRCEVDYLSPARLDDELEVRTTLRALGSASLQLDQAIWRLPAVGAGESRELARLTVRLAVVKRDGRPTRLPASLALRLRSLAATPADDVQSDMQPDAASAVHRRASAQPAITPSANNKHLANKKRA